MVSVLYAIAKTLPEGRVRGTVETVAGRTVGSYESRPVSSRQPRYVSYKEAEESGTPGTGKVGRIIDYVSGGLLEGRVRDTVGSVSGRVFTRISPPPSFKKRVDLPLEIYSSGQPRATDLYYRLAYQGYMGRDTGRTSRQLVGELVKSRHWWETYAQFESGKTWRDVKRDDPALFLTLDPFSGKFSPKYDFSKWYYEEYRPQKEKRVGGLLSAIGDISYSYANIFEEGTWKAAISGDIPSYHARKEYENIMDIQKGKGWEVWARIQIPAYTTVILPMVGAGAIGAGLGALKATSVGSKVLFSIGTKSLTVGKAVELGIVGYGSYEAGKSFARDPLGTGISLAMTLPFVYTGYKAGHRFGYGRMEEYLYGKYMFKSGSAELIRFKSALKVGRKLYPVKSDINRPLNFAKDIMRLDPKSANKVISYLRSYPKTVIGGSAASYTQIKPGLWSRFRHGVKPRDIDLLVKDVSQAKGYIGGRSHQIDIHGFDFGGKPGRYHRFGFITQDPTRIGEFWYMRLSEQVFRKGIGGTILETGYRWFKDIPDFVMSSEQLISSAKSSLNPLNWIRAKFASIHLSYFIKPSKHPSFGQPESFFGSFFKKIVKPAPSPNTTGVIGGYLDYGYPSYIYPSAMTFLFTGGYYPKSPSLDKSLVFDYSEPFKTKIKPYYKQGKPSYTFKNLQKDIQKYVSVKQPGYKPGKYPKAKDVSYIPSYKTLGYKPGGYPPSIIPSLKPDTSIIKIDDLISRRRKPDPFDELFGKKYKFREFKVANILKDFGI